MFFICVHITKKLQFLQILYQFGITCCTDGKQIGNILMTFLYNVRYLWMFTFLKSTMTWDIIKNKMRYDLIWIKGLYIQFDIKNSSFIKI